ncbi:hypothetical protein [Haloimpatiens lingqiaonensis]|uniref:hypothetical protein n=1 Tax=Haloimpatiens lingqiaonensis TaxID=1380675 RepID=UPI001484EDE3|nr:hypothetical protein [Haloimpatiens lingqiaonensis]
MDKKHSFIFIPEHHFTSTLFSVFEVKIRKCKDFSETGLRGMEINRKMEENNK